MALDALLAKLDADAEREREAVLAAAAEQAAAIRSEADREIERRRAEALANVRLEEERTARSGLMEAREEARRMVLDARRKALDRVRSVVRERIAKASGDPVYHASLGDEVRAALQRLPAGEVTARTGAALMSHVQAAADAAAASGRTGISVIEDPDVDPGFLVSADGGRIVVDATLEARLGADWPRHATWILRQLDGATGSPPDGKPT